jgi:hypothetical protein
MKKLNTLLLLLLCLALVLAACGGDEPAATPAQVEPPAAGTPESAGTPEESQAPESPLAAPESPLAAPESPLDTPDSAAIDLSAETSDTTGAVTGVVRISSEERQEPVANVKVALARVLTDDNGVERATGYSPSRAPHSTSDSEGRFVIGDVPPGRYGIILDGIVTSIMLADATTGESIIISVEAGEVTDIGVREYESLPIPGYTELKP